MKRIVLLSLLLFPIFLFAQYPTFSNKQRLGVQTTGDGLIFRGRNNPNYYTPNNINNAYFYLDTLTSKLYLYNISDWQQIYPTTSDTTSLGNFLLKSDTLAMLLPYLRKADTISLSNRINNKLNVTDTVSLSNRINLKLNQTDTINLSNRIDLKLNKSDTISLSNRINTKLNSSDTVSLSNRINKKLDTLYINYQNNVELLNNKDTINISNTLTEGFGINIIADSINIDSAVILATQQKQIAYVKNESGVTMYKGQAVYSSGSNGNNKLVQLASSSTEQTSSKTFGIVESESILNGQHGYIITFGLLEKINTNGLTEGSSIYLSSTPGELTTTKPQAPLHLVTIGVCIRRQQNNGSIFVKIQNGFELDELHDVRITSPVNNASLYYSNGLWRDTTATLLVSDTVSMLSKYVNTYSNQTNINGDKTFNNTVTIDSATVTGKLLVNTNISDAVKITSNTNSTNLELMNNSGTVYIKSSNKNMILQTDTTALVYLNGNNKKVGILTMNPQKELQVAGNVRIDSLNNNLVPTNLVGSSNNNDLTNVHLGEGLSFTNDTLKVDLTIIDTAIAASSITLVGNVSGTGSTNSTVNTTINNGVVTNDMLAGGISDSKLNTITTAGKVDNSATTATSSNNPNTIVLRDNNRDFTARNITATNFYGNASTATVANGVQSILSTGIIKLATTSNAVQPTITVPDVNATMATTNLNQTFGGTQTFTNTIVGNISGNASTVTSVTPSNFANQSANTILAAPNGSSGTPSFRSLVSADIPSLNYLPLTGGTLTGNLFGTNQGLNSNLTISDIIPGNSAPIFTTITTGPSSNETVRFGLNQSLSGGANMFMGGTQGLGGNPTNPNIYFTDSRKAYASIGGIHTSGGTNNQSGHIVFNTTPSVNTIALTERMRIAQDGLVSIVNNATIGGTLGVTSNITANSFIKSGGTTSQFLKANGDVDSNTYLTTSSAASTYLPLTGGTTSGLITSSFTNTSNYSTSATDNNAFQIYNNTTSSNNIYGGIQFLIGQNSGAIPGGPGLAQIYAIRAGGVSNPSTDLSFSTKGAGGVLEKMRIKFDGKIGIGTSTPSYLLDVNGQIGSTGFIKSGGTSSQFLKADGSVDANTYLTTGTASSTYLPLSGGTVSGSILNSWTSAYTSAPRNDGAVRRTYTTNLYSANGGTTDRVTHYYTFSQDECCASAPVTMYYGRFNGFYNQANIIYDASIYYHNNNQFYYRAFSESENKVTFSIKPSTTINSISGTKADLYLSGDAQIDRSLNIGTTLGVTGATTLSSTLAVTGAVTLSTTTATPTSLLGKNGSNVVGNITVGSGLSLSSGTLSATATGTVTSVTASTPLSSSGGNTPNITIADASASASGVVNTTTQSFAGNKTFTGNVIISGSSTLNVGSNGTFGGRVNTPWLERTYTYTTSSSITVGVNTTWLDINTSVLTTLTLPNAATYPGKEIHIRQTGAGSLQSASSNIIPFSVPPTGNTSPGILTASTHRSVTLVSDGNNWIIMQRSDI